MYAPFIALLLALFSLSEIHISIVPWGILQVGCVILYLLLFRWFVPTGLRFQLLFVLIALTSFPLWHNLSWGQVGIITAAAVLGILALFERGRRISAAVLVGIAAGLKFFPIIFLAPFAFRRDFRFLLLASLACIAFFVVVPGILMGPGNTLTFYHGLIDTFSESEWVVSNYNSQYFSHVFLRLTVEMGFNSRPYLPLFNIFSFSLVVLSLVLVYFVQRTRLSHANLWSVHLLFLSIPFFLKTSWPVDLVYISFAQAFLSWQITAGKSAYPDAPRKQLTSGILLTLVIISIGLSNMVTFHLIGDHEIYGFLGFIFWADLLCLVASYILLIPLGLSFARS
jgi:uncharacterized membrane protein